MLKRRNPGFLGFSGGIERCAQRNFPADTGVPAGELSQYTAFESPTPPSR